MELAIFFGSVLAMVLIIGFAIYHFDREYGGHGPAGGPASSEPFDPNLQLPAEPVQATTEDLSRAVPPPLPPPLTQPPSPTRSFPVPDSSGRDARPSDSVGYFLEIAGWILLGLSILGGIVIAGNASSDYDSTVSPAFGIVAGFVGSLQSLILAGFGRLIQSNAESAELQRRTVQLLQEAVAGSQN